MIKLSKQSIRYNFNNLVYKERSFYVNIKTEIELNGTLEFTFLYLYKSRYDNPELWHKRKMIYNTSDSSYPLIVAEFPVPNS